MDKRAALAIAGVCLALYSVIMFIAKTKEDPYERMQREERRYEAVRQEDLRQKYDADNAYLLRIYREKDGVTRPGIDREVGTQVLA